MHFSSYHVLCYKYCHKAEAEAELEVGEEEWGVVRRHAGVSVTMGDIGDIGDMATIAGILARVTNNSTKVSSKIACRQVVLQQVEVFSSFGSGCPIK